MERLVGILYAMLTTIIIAFFSSHQIQIIDPVNQIPTVIGLVFAIGVTLHFYTLLKQLTDPSYKPMRLFLELLLGLIGIGLSWVLATITGQFYGESLSPFFTLESLYRTLSFIFIMAGFMTLATYYSTQNAEKTD